MLRVFACVAVILVASPETGLMQEALPGRQGRVEIHPFDNLSGQPDDEWIGAGIADALAADLRFTRGEVRWLVRGAYQRVGDQIRITATLVRSDSGLVVASITVDGGFAELFGLQDRLAARLMAAAGGVRRRQPSDEVAAGVNPSDSAVPPGPAQATAGATPEEVVTGPAQGVIDGPPPPVPPAVMTRDPSGRVTMRAIRLDEPLRLDGQLDERVYQTIAPVTDFIQQEPTEGAPATEQTEVWVLFDGETVYVAARCWDSRPDQTVANEMRRDSYGMYGNDTFALMLDTFYDRRNGFNFMTNALGGLFDQTITNERSTNLDWNTVWDVQTTRFEQGWTLEMAIPFKSLRYGTDAGQLWGINFQRRVAWKNETSFLTPIPAALRSSGNLQFSSAATLVGLEVPASATRFEVKPYAIADLATDLGASPRVLNQLGGAAGFDVKYGVTQGLTADFTYNTDFAQVEVDEQQVNLTRFSLFFPEKREFFLEGQGIFNFGAGYEYDPITSYFTGALSGGAAPALFFSRRIGLEDGQTVPILAGGRLTGKVGPYSIGLLDVQTGEESLTGSRPTNFSVIRVRRDVLRRSAVGGMLTGRSVSAKGQGASYTYGVDGVFSFYDNLSLNTYLAKTETPGLPGDDLSYQTEVDYSGDRWSLKLERLGVGANFNPEVGFLRRNDFRRTFAEFRYSPRPQSLASVRRFLMQPSIDYITDGAGRLETRLQQLLLGAEFENGDRLFGGVTDNFEYLKRPFRIAQGVSVPVGGYSFVNTRLVYALGEQRPITGAITFDRGGFFDGEKVSVGYNRPRVNLGAQLTVEPSLSFNWITLPEATFTSGLVSTRVTYTVTPRMFVSTLLQFNSSNDSLGTNVRFRWEYQPGSELFVVYTDERDTLTPRFPALENRALVVKVNRLLRF
jgi:hypothetical protein